MDLHLSRIAANSKLLGYGSFKIVTSGELEVERKDRVARHVNEAEQDGAKLRRPLKVHMQR